METVRAFVMMRCMHDCQADSHFMTVSVRHDDCHDVLLDENRYTPHRRINDYVIPATCCCTKLGTFVGVSTAMPVQYAALFPYGPFLLRRIHYITCNLTPPLE